MTKARSFYFGPPSRPLFGWHHAPEAAQGRGVVLCNPLGLDMTRAHRSYRHLAERLASAGIATLRFDWHGTGDSSGDEREPDRVATWIADLHLAIDELRRRSGAGSIALVGLRAGAALAGYVAAERDDIDGVALWMPSLSGAAWVAEMAKLHKLYLRIVPQAGGAEPDGEELLGSFVSTATIADLARVDLLALVRRPAPRVLVVDDGGLRDPDRLRSHLQEAGSEVTWRRTAGAKFLVTVPHRAALPDEPLDAIVGWVSALPSVAASRAVMIADEETPSIERPIHFGDGERLFGILVAPVAPPPPDRPAIVLLDAGTVNRVGPHRLYVTLARRWVALGFAVLRVDLSGIGDSPAAEGTPENLTYPASALTDVAAALDLLEREVSARRFVVAGLCSGADLAYQVARRDPRVAGAVMMNPRTFLELSLGSVEGQAPDAWSPDAASTVEALRVTAGLEAISARGIDALLLVSRRDPGVDFVDRYAPEAMRAAERLPGFRRVDVDGADHTFTTLASQRRVSDLVTAEFLAGYLERRLA